MFCPLPRTTRRDWNSKRPFSFRGDVKRGSSSPSPPVTRVPSSAQTNSSPLPDSPLVSAPPLACSFFRSPCALTCVCFFGDYCMHALLQRSLAPVTLDYIVSLMVFTQIPSARPINFRIHQRSPASLYIIVLRPGSSMLVDVVMASVLLPRRLRRNLTIECCGVSLCFHLSSSTVQALLLSAGQGTRLRL